ncbi:CubicO group peptidase (beta-lactamase class C family) [Catenuloplanes nepalensis]|uniref:CubicO group peptidase (Beta-lactamase class C family) n=1 Tax=Catenuloplanes nepalensis TaxID=587533 RepID=A0ABT9MVL7_9ACTN|nr:serine hydrolase domain-containing protein [Catenuloplanes nepalensis]MDP9795424.1 CubicO group peptidase (beta-lactamase class C family) [Catenuloplanes nepalensis]
MDEIADISRLAAEFTEAPGLLAGVYRGGEQHVIAHGVANAATGAPMRADTGFLFGSITKIMTTTLVMRQVEHGLLRLDTPVAAHLPEPAIPGLRVEHLLNHTSGIDADLFFPDEAGRDALKIYVERLARECGTLFPPGEYVSYANGGMIVAGRLLEVVTGLTYDELLARDLFAPTGMTTACTSAEQAILRSTAIGHFQGRPTGMFMLPRTWGPAGATPIGTIEDLLAFGRVHLGDDETATRMRTVTRDMGTPDISAIGLGWLIRPDGVLTMTGASPGGVALLAAVTASWTFTSAHTTVVTPLPLSAVVFTPAVTDAGIAPTGREFPVPVRIDGPATSSPQVEVSFDDGRTWQPAPVRHNTAIIRHPNRPAFVSLRATTGTTTQTIIRAYDIR